MSRHSIIRGFVYGISCAIIGLGFYGFFIEPKDVQFRTIEIQDQRLGGILKGKVAAHISDLHMKKIGRREMKIIEAVNGAEPDYIFLTGDYVAWDGDYDDAVTFLSQLKAKSGMWAIMGDYDYSNSRKSCMFCHDESGGGPVRHHSVRFLRNRIEKVSLPGGYFWIGGVDPGDVDRITSFEQFLKGTEEDPVILLSHNPLTFDRIDGGRDLLMLSGDTHGGQVPLPAWLYRVLGYQKNAKYNQGYFEEKRKKMFVSRGIGTSHLPFRFLRKPEVVFFHFSSTGQHHGSER